MSYDLMVFDPQGPPPNREGFMEWYRQQTQWNEGHSYDNADLTTSDLRAWYRDMLSQYPAMNGPDSSDDVDNPKVTDYSIGKSVIYAAFSWSEAEGALNVMFRFAEKHRVGFFDVSAEDGGVWLPAPSGEYLCVHGEGAKAQNGKQWWQPWKK
jgi:hypothetical protein